MLSVFQLFCLKFLKTVDVGHSKGEGEVEEEQQQQQQKNLSDDLNAGSTTSSSLDKMTSHEDMKSPYVVKTLSCLAFPVFPLLSRYLF